MHTLLSGLRNYGTESKTSGTQNGGQGNTNQRVIKVPASIGRVRNRGTGTIAGDDIAGDNLERKPYVPRGYKMTEEKIEVAGFVHGNF